MNRIDHLFGRSRLLQFREYVTADALAEKFKISARAVYRDVKALCEQSIPMGFEPDKVYFVVQGYFLPPVSFSSDEANTLLLMESMAFGFADKSMHTHSSAALSKVKAVLRGAQQEKLDQLNRNIRF